MKKLLLTVLTALSFVGLTACGNGGKKLSEAEAKEELKAIAKNTANEMNEIASVSSKASFKGSISTKKIISKVEGTDMSLTLLDSAKASAKFSAENTLELDKEKKIIKETFDMSGNASYSVSGDFLKLLIGEKSKKDSYEASAKGEAYLYDNADDETIVCADYSVKLPEAFTKKYSTEELALLSGKHKFVGADAFISDLIEEYTTSDSETEFDFDFIKDWTIFSKKGNKIIADCSDLKAFDLDEDYLASTVILEKFGINLKVSKFEIEVNDKNVITDFVLETSVKGTINLEKIDLEDEELKDLIEEYEDMPYVSTLITLAESNLTGKINVDLSFDTSSSITYGTKTLIVPESYNNVKAEDLDDIFDLLDLNLDNLVPGSNDKGNAAARTADNVYAAAKNVLLESAAMGEPLDGVTKNGNTYSVTVNSLVTMGELDKNPFDSTTGDGGMTISIDETTFQFNATVTGTINGYSLVYDGNNFTAYKD
ncbi:MAG: hypothetical protein J6Y28_00820 [Acholeplasmatales bacterium]|nr:hypothetical protein [Acholeplasmatales bacterium]